MTNHDFSKPPRVVWEYQEVEPPHVWVRCEADDWRAFSSMGNPVRATIDVRTEETWQQLVAIEKGDV